MCCDVLSSAVDRDVWDIESVLGSKEVRIMCCDEGCVV